MVIIFSLCVSNIMKKLQSIIHLPVLKASFLGLVLALAACDDSSTTVSKTANTKKSTAKTNAAAEKPTKKGMYDFEAWSKTPISLRGTQAAGLVSVIGLPGATSEQTLDYYGKGAVKQKLRGNDAVFFNLIESNDLTEMTWFKASKKDTADVKQLGGDNAKKAFLAARAMIGEVGGKLVEEIITSENGESTVVHEKLVEAKCEAFFCRMVVKKS